MRRTLTALGAVLVMACGLATPAQAAPARAATGQAAPARVATAQAATAQATSARAATAQAASARAASASVVTGRVRVSPARYAGVCPATTAFAATVKVRGASGVSYRWLRGDGTKGPVTTARVKGGTAVVRDRQTFAVSTSGWQALQVLSPKRATSAKARFTVACDKVVGGAVSTLPVEHAAPRATATVAAPAPYSGACPAPGHTVTFTGTVKVSRTPASVTYRWVDGDGGPEPAERLWFASGGPAGRTVASRRSFLTSGSGHRWLEILDAKERVLDRSGRAVYRVTCSPPPDRAPVAAVTNPRVTPAVYEGACEVPVTFVFRADLAVTKPAKVTYQWVRGDGTKIPGTVELKGDLTTVLETSWQVTDPSKLATGSATLQVLTPNRTATAPTAFTITCKQDPVTIMRAHLIDIANPNQCGQNTHNFSAVADVLPTKYATMPLTISYQWRWADGSHSAPRTHTFTQLTYVTAAQSWSEWISKKGQVWLEVIAEGKVTRSERLPYEVSCDGKPPTDSYPRVVSITDAAVTPSAYTGTCPVKLKARAKITMSAPLDKDVVAQWRFPQLDQAAVAYASFPAGGPLTKEVESDITVNKSSTGTATGYLESALPNLMVSNELSYTVTCT